MDEDSNERPEQHQPEERIIDCLIAIEQDNGNLKDLTVEFIKLIENLENERS